MVTEVILALTLTSTSVTNTYRRAAFMWKNVAEIRAEENEVHLELLNNCRDQVETYSELSQPMHETASWVWTVIAGVGIIAFGGGVYFGVQGR